MRTARTQNSLRRRTVLSEPLVFALLTSNHQWTLSNYPRKLIILIIDAQRHGVAGVCEVRRFV